jgi:hypothetical protein
MRIRGIEIGASQRGWTCDVHYTVETTRQFTAEQHTARDGGRWIWLAIWRAMRRAKAEAKLLSAKPGERAAIGWN